MKKVIRMNQMKTLVCLEYLVDWRMLAEKEIYTTMYELETGWEHYDFQLVFIEPTADYISRAI